jgi:Tripartite tricarboxylate transporter TctB family
MISRRALEATTAVLTGTFGTAVVVQSIDNGIGWSSAGVDAGTFPFMVGLIILAGSLFNLTRGALSTRAIALDWPDLRRLALLFVPAGAFVAVIPLIGMYAASGAYMFGTLALQNRVSIARSVVLAVATPVALYVVFERMFQVSLPHGAIGAALGF